VIGNFLYEKPEFKVEIEQGSMQDIRKGQALMYEMTYFDEGNSTAVNLTFVYLGDRCVETFLGNQSIASHCGSESIVQFPLLLAYPKSSGKAVVNFYSESKSSKSLISKIEYTKLRELEYNGKDAIEVESSIGEKFMLEKKTGIILLMNTSELSAEIKE
jgi:hypothetical protein